MTSQGLLCPEWLCKHPLHPTKMYRSEVAEAEGGMSLLAWVGKQLLLFLMTEVFAGQLGLSCEASGINTWQGRCSGHFLKLEDC